MDLPHQTEFKAVDYGARPDGVTCSTLGIQAAVDAAFVRGGGRVTFEKGIYLTGAIFVKSNVELFIDAGVEIRGIQDETAYPDIWSRVAGIEMNWPSGLVNIIEAHQVKISGSGIINGQGEYWWDKYWGTDKLGGMRKGYTAKGLRWAVDYDCKRPRNVIVLNSSEVGLENFTSIRSPFWNVHICYSDRVWVDRVVVKDNLGPSTDGIDIDSSTRVRVENCDIDCNDDNVCVKSGRDADGLRVNKPAEKIIIRNCRIGHGEGITLGSETSGGIRDVEIDHIKAYGSHNGLRFKSSRTRGGLIENITVHDLEFIDVAYPFSFQLDWNPSYSYATIPENWRDAVPDHWKVLAQPVEPPERGIPEFKKINIFNVTAKCGKGTNEERRIPSRAFDVYAYAQKPIHQVCWKNIMVEAERAGSIANARDWMMENVVLRTTVKEPLKLENCHNVQLPKVEFI